MKRSLLPSTRYLIAIPIAALLVAACGGSDSSSTAGGGSDSGGTSGASANGGAIGVNGGAANGGTQNSAGTSGKSGSSGAAGLTGSAGSSVGSGAAGDTGSYDGPTVGRAQTFAALAYSAITAANISTLSGDIGVSAGAMSKITGFSAPGTRNTASTHSRRTACARSSRKRT